MPRNKYPEETVQKILDASFKLFMEKGYENTTVLDIVDEMGGLTRGAFYHHFKSKEEVVSALSDKMFYENNPFDKIKQEKGLNGIQKLQKITKDSLEVSDYRKIMEQSLDVLKDPKFLAEMLEGNRTVLVPAYQELIEEGIADGSIQVQYPRQTAEIFTMLTNFWMIPSIFPYELEEEIARVEILKKITDNLGLPIIDEELMKKVRDMVKSMK